jgi:hypothetical protein
LAYAPLLLCIKIYDYSFDLNGRKRSPHPLAFATEAELWAWVRARRKKRRTRLSCYNHILADSGGADETNRRVNSSGRSADNLTLGP